jgi:hypothetical protein
MGVKFADVDRDTVVPVIEAGKIRLDGFQVVVGGGDDEVGISDFATLKTVIDDYVAANKELEEIA